MPTLRIAATACGVVLLLAVAGVAASGTYPFFTNVIACTADGRCITTACADATTQVCLSSTATPAVLRFQQNTQPNTVFVVLPSGRYLIPCFDGVSPCTIESGISTWPYPLRWDAEIVLAVGPSNTVGFLLIGRGYIKFTDDSPSTATSTTQWFNILDSTTGAAVYPGQSKNIVPNLVWSTAATATNGEPVSLGTFQLYTPSVQGWWDFSSTGQAVTLRTKPTGGYAVFELLVDAEAFVYVRDVASGLYFAQLPSMDNLQLTNSTNRGAMRVVLTSFVDQFGLIYLGVRNALSCQPYDGPILANRIKVLDWERFTATATSPSSVDLNAILARRTRGVATPAPTGTTAPSVSYASAAILAAAYPLLQFRACTAAGNCLSTTCVDRTQKLCLVPPTSPSSVFHLLTGFADNMVRMEAINAASEQQVTPCYDNVHACISTCGEPTDNTYVLIVGPTPGSVGFAIPGRMILRFQGAGEDTPWLRLLDAQTQRPLLPQLTANVMPNSVWAQVPAAEATGSMVSLGMYYWVRAADMATYVDLNATGAVVMTVTTTPGGPAPFEFFVDAAANVFIRDVATGLYLQPQFDLRSVAAVNETQKGSFRLALPGKVGQVGFFVGANGGVRAALTTQEPTVQCNRIGILITERFALVPVPSNANINTAAILARRGVTSAPSGSPSAGNDTSTSAPVTPLASTMTTPVPPTPVASTMTTPVPPTRAPATSAPASPPPSFTTPIPSQSPSKAPLSTATSAASTNTHSVGIDAEVVVIVIACAAVTVVVLVGIVVYLCLCRRRPKPAPVVVVPIAPDISMATMGAIPKPREHVSQDADMGRIVAVGTVVHVDSIDVSASMYPYGRGGVYTARP